MHPDIETMVSCIHGELGRGQERRVHRHLLSCRICRGNYGRLEASLLGPPPPRPAGSGLIDRLRAWDSARQANPASERLKSRVAGELAPYMGHAGADLLIRDTHGDNVLSHVTLFLNLFLGRRAAGRLVTRVVENAIVGESTL